MRCRSSNSFGIRGVFIYTLHLAARDIYCRVLMGVMVELSVCKVAMVYIGMDWLGMLTV